VPKGEPYGFKYDLTPRAKIVRTDDAFWPVVAATRSRLPGPGRLCRLLDLGRVPGRVLCVRELTVALLLPGDLRRDAPCALWSEAELVAELAPVVAGLSDPVDAGRISPHLLLLPGSLLL